MSRSCTFVRSNTTKVQYFQVCGILERKKYADDI